MLHFSVDAEVAVQQRVRANLITVGEVQVARVRMGCDGKGHNQTREARLSEGFGQNKTAMV